MRAIEKKAGLILGGIFLFSLVLVGVVFAIEAPTTASVTVNTFLSVTLFNTPIGFVNMDPGETKNATVSTGFPLNASIGPESNVNANVTTKANNESFGGVGNFLVSNMEWSATSAFPGIDYTTSDASVCSPVTPGANCTIYHQLTIPSGQAAGSYNVGITITATPAV